MKKNGEYIGVDDEFIPEDEKYVDESIIGDRKASNEKIKKVAKRIGIGYIIFFIIIFAIVMGIIIFTLFNFINMSNNREKLSTITLNKGNMFTFNHLQGTNYGNIIKEYLDDVVTNNKAGGYTTITVVYNDKLASEEETIVEIKHLLEDWTKYECSLDYASSNVVNKITIKDI